MDLTLEGKQFLDYWGIIVRRRWVLGLTLVGAVIVSLMGSLLASPLYLASATLQVQRQNPNVLNMRDLVQVDYAWNAYADFYQTEYKIMSSAAVARHAAERLGVSSHPLFDREASKPSLMARLKALIPRRGVENDQPMDPLDIAAGRIRQNLLVNPVRHSQLVKVSWIGGDPDQAAEVANAVVDAYIQFNIAAQYSTTDQAREFLIDQIGTLRNEIQAIEERLQEYGESKGIVSIDDSNNITLQALQNIAQRRTEAQTQLATSRADFEAVRDAPANALPQVLASTLIGSLREEYASLEAELSQKSRRFKEDWPGMQTLRSKLEQARTRLDLEIEHVASQVRATKESEYLRAEQVVANLDALLGGQEKAAQELKRDAVQFTNLQSEVTKKRDTLNALMQRQNEMALSTRLKDMESSSTNVRVMERAKAPRTPFRPRIKFNLLVGVMVGLALGVFLALFLDYLDNTINSPAEVKRLVGLPTLAGVPRQSTSSAKAMSGPRGRPQPATPAPFDQIAHLDRHAPASEAYRELRTAILLSHAGQPPRHIMITSALPEEGKSATSINLSIVLAQLGGRVLLLDTDLRRPRLHRALGIENRRGVSTYLSGLENEAHRAVVTTEIENLDLMPSGPIPPNPSELLNSARFTQMCQELLDRGYDHVVLDSPPVLSVSDPVVIANVVDTAILVIRAGRTARQSVKMAVDKLGQAGGNLSGVVLNDIEADSSYHRYYYYGRYGEPEESEESDDGRAVGKPA